MADSARCMKCRKTVEIKNPTQATTKTGRPMIKGNCSICDGKVSKFVKKSA